MEGFVEAARRSLAEVQGLFGVPASTSTSAGVSSTGGGGAGPGWSGTASGREQASAVALDNRRREFSGADRQLDAWGRQTAADTANGRASAGALVTSADNTTRALAPYTGSVPGRVALVSSLTDHLSRSAGVAQGYAATLPGRQADLAAIAAQYGTPPPGTPPPAPPPPRRP
ncbi:hypothetical protein VXE65_33015, partial [Mycolicibacterium conceptionense]